MTGREKVRTLLDRLERAIERQLAPILDHPEFRRLHRAWEGLHYLLRSVPTGETLKIRVLDLTLDEIRTDLAGLRGAEGRRSLLHREFHDMVFGSFGGEPFGLIVVDGEVDGSDVRLREDLEQLARAAHAVLVVAGPTGERPHLRITPTTTSLPYGTVWTEAARVGTAWGRIGWFSDLEHGEEDEAGRRFASLLSAEVVARTAKWVAIMGRSQEREDLERELTRWLSRYEADGEPTPERPLSGASITVEYDLDRERDLTFRLRLSSGWNLTPLPEGLEIVGHIERR